MDIEGFDSRRDKSFSGAQGYERLGEAVFEEANSPEFRVHETSPALTYEQTATLNQQWQTFWNVRSKEIHHSRVIELPAGAMLHHMEYSLDNFRKVCRQAWFRGSLGSVTRKL